MADKKELLIKAGLLTELGTPIPELLVAMDEWAKEVAIAFAQLILKEAILPRDINWFDAGSHFTSEELFLKYLQSKQITNGR